MCTVLRGHNSGGGAGRARKPSTSAVRVPEPAGPRLWVSEKVPCCFRWGKGGRKRFHARRRLPCLCSRVGARRGGRSSRVLGGMAGLGAANPRPGAAPALPSRLRRESRSRGRGGSGRSLTEGLGPPRGPQTLRSPPHLAAAFLKACSLRCLLPRASCPALGR